MVVFGVLYQLGLPIRTVEFLIFFQVVDVLVFKHRENLLAEPLVDESVLIVFDVSDLSVISFILMQVGVRLLIHPTEIISREEV